MQFKISNAELMQLNGATAPVFPKYSTQLLNLANQNAGGTTPRVVGQLSNLFPEFEKSANTKDLKSWEKWYLSKFPNAIDMATDKVFTAVQNLQKSITQIDKPMVGEWVRDLVITKTFNGMRLQEAILVRAAEIKNLPFRSSTPAEEARGIDGFIGSVAYSVKPDTYKTMNRLPEQIKAVMCFYAKTKTGINIEIID